MKTEQEQEQEIQQNLQFVNRLREIYKQRAGELMRPLSKKKEKDEEEPRCLGFRPCTTVEELERATVLKIVNDTDATPTEHAKELDKKQKEIDTLKERLGKIEGIAKGGTMSDKKRSIYNALKNGIKEHFREKAIYFNSKHHNQATMKIPYIYKEKYLPNNEVAERGLLSCIMQDYSLLPVCECCGIGGYSFHMPIHAALYAVLKNIECEIFRKKRRGEQVSDDTIASYLTQQGVERCNARPMPMPSFSTYEWEWWIGNKETCLSIINFIKNTCKDTHLALYFMEIIHEKARRRELIKASQEAGVFKATDLLANSTIYKNAKYIEDISIVPDFGKEGYVMMVHFQEDKHREAVEMKNALLATSNASMFEESNMNKAVEEILKKRTMEDEQL